MSSEASTQVGSVLGNLEVGINRIKKSLLNGLGECKDAGDTSEATDEKIAVALLALHRVEDLIDEEKKKLSEGLNG